MAKESHAGLFVSMHLLMVCIRSNFPFLGSFNSSVIFLWTACVDKKWIASADKYGNPTIA